MNPDSKYAEIAAGLLKKTRQGKARWETANQGNAAFVLALPQSLVHLEYQAPSAAPDAIKVTFKNRDGRPVGSWLVHDGDDHWDLLSDLYGEVNRQVAGWDTVLEDLERFIKDESKAPQSTG
jgi:hypothetical protein